MSDDLIKRDDALNACVLREDNPPTEMQLSLRNVISALPAVDRIEELEAKLAKAAAYLQKISRHANRSCSAIAARALTELEGKE